MSSEEKEIKKSRILMKPLLIDLGIAFLIVSLISAAYMIAGAELLGKQHLLPSDINLIEEQAIIFSNIAIGLKPLYQISVFFALFGTAYAGFETASRMLYETTKNLSKKIRGITYKKFMLYLLIYLLITGIPLSIIMYLGGSVLLLLSITLLFLGVIGVIIYGIGVVFLSQSILPKKYRLGTLGLIVTIAGIGCLLIPIALIFL